MTSLKAIKAFCCSSCCETSQQARKCPAINCKLYTFRLGRNPNRAGVGNFNSPVKNSLTRRDSKTNAQKVGNFTSEESDAEKPRLVQAPLPTIRRYCLDCCLGQAVEVAACPVTNCALHPFRFGTNPARAGGGKSKTPASATVSERRVQGVDKTINRREKIVDPHLQEPVSSAEAKEEAHG